METKLRNWAVITCWKTSKLNFLNKLETKLRSGKKTPISETNFWFWKRSFDSGNKTPISKTNLRFWKRSFKFELKHQFGNEALTLEKKLRFRKQSFDVGNEALNSENKVSILEIKNMLTKKRMVLMGFCSFLLFFSNCVINNKSTYFALF